MKYTFQYVSQGWNSAGKPFIGLTRSDGNYMSVSPEKYEALKAAGRITGVRVLNTPNQH